MCFARKIGHFANKIGRLASKRLIQHRKRAFWCVTQAWKKDHMILSLFSEEPVFAKKTGVVAKLGRDCQ